MKEITTALLTLCFCLLAACAGLERNTPASPALETAPAGAPPVEPDFQLDTTSVENTYASEDGTEVACYTYQLLTLTVANPEELSGAAAEEAARVADAFNERMIGLMEESTEAGRSVGEIALSQYDMRGHRELYYYDRTGASASILGQVVSVRMDNSVFTGGAHPNRYVSGYLFDLQTGQFLNPIQLAGDPEAFRTGAAEALLEQLEAREDLLADCWPEYPEIISRWNEGTVLFDKEGMVVAFSPYELGPYSMGEVELRLTYEELAPLVGEAGTQKLGIDGE